MTSDFQTVGDTFSMQTIPERKTPFDIRTVVRAVADPDDLPLERRAATVDADTVERALRTGAIHAIIPADRPRPHVNEAVQRATRRTRERG
jgi:hypothetical protein